MLVLLGKSIEGRPIRAFVGPGPAANTILVLGGIHGDEPKGVYVAQHLIDVLEAEPDAHADVRWVVIPVVNPDGYERRRRRNANQVDINRNFPTKNWCRTLRRSRMFGGKTPASEPETRAVIKAVKRYSPARIISIHSIGEAKYCNNYDGPARTLAKRMQRHNRYPVVTSMGYPTPGSFGTWAGIERNIPTITLELPSHYSPKKCWEDNHRALLAMS